MNSVLRFLALAVVLFSLPAPAEAALVFCPGTADLTDREFAVDITGATADCFDFGTGNSLTGGASDTFLNEHDAILDFIDADGPPNQTDNGYYYTNLGETDIAGVTYLFGEFFIDSILTDVNNVLYFGFKVGTVDPTWVVFRLTGFADAADLSGLWYTTPKQGGGISHSSIYGGFVPPDVTPDPVVPEPTSLLLLGSGLAVSGMAARRRRRTS